MGAVFNSTGHRLDIPEIVSGDGIYLTGADGARYVDFTSGVWCTSLGHNHPRVTTAIRTQLEELAHAGFCYSHPVVEEAADAVRSVVGMPDGAVVFLCSGSEGIDYARQVAKTITERARTLAFHDAYLGSFSAVLDRTGDWVTVDWEMCTSCPDGRRRSDCDHLDGISRDVAEFVFEPGSSSGQVRFAPSPFVRNLVDGVRANGGKIIVNEVTTGIGRTGSWFGFDHYGIQPDLVVIGKGVGNGYPVSAVVMTRETAQELEETSFKYMQSHQNDPLGAAVVKEVIATIRDESLIERSATNGRALLEALQRLLAHPAVGAVRGRGLMFAVELTSETAGRAAFRRLLDRGYIVCPRGATLRIDPPLVTPLETLLAFAQALEEALAALD